MEIEWLLDMAEVATRPLQLGADSQHAFNALREHQPGYNHTLGLLTT